MKSQLVTVTNGGDEAISLTVQTVVDDGRERHDNGRYVIAPGAQKGVLVDETQSIRVDAVKPAEIAPEVPEVQDEHQ